MVHVFSLLEQMMPACISMIVGLIAGHLGYVFVASRCRKLLQKSQNNGFIF